MHAHLTGIKSNQEQSRAIKSNQEHSRAINGLDEAEHVGLGPTHTQRHLDLGIGARELKQRRLGQFLMGECTPIVGEVRLEPRDGALGPITLIKEVIKPQPTARCLGGVHGRHALERRQVGRAPRADQVEHLWGKRGRGAVVSACMQGFGTRHERIESSAVVSTL